MRLVAAIMFVVFWGVAATAETTIDRVHHGRLDLVTKIEDNSDHPIPDVESVRREVRLEWRSADGRVALYLKDTGRLTTNFVVAKPGDVADPDVSNWVCFGGGQLQAYQSRKAPAARWKQALQNDFSSLLTSCIKWISPAQRAAYLAEAANAADDFGLTLEAMKAAAQRQFGGWRRRCVEEEHVKNTPFDFRCIRYSSEEY